VGMGMGQETIVLGKPLGLGVDDSARLVHVQAKALQRFLQSIGGGGVL